MFGFGKTGPVAVLVFSQIKPEMVTDWPMKKRFNADQVIRVSKQAKDPSFVIFDHAVAQANPSRLCAATIDLFASIMDS